MRNYILLAILCLIFSCKSNTKQPAKDSTSIAANAEGSDLLIKKFRPLLQGTWVKKAYIDKVGANKSPMATIDEASGITIFTIDTTEMTDNGITVHAGWNNHEGGDITLSFKAGKRPSSVIFGDGELSADVNHGDTILTIYYPGAKNQIKTDRFIRANGQKIMEIDKGFARTINKAFMTGKYTLLDTTTSKPVEFDINGNITGFKDFKSYSILVDLDMEPMDNLDEISFKGDKKIYQSFSFKFDGDTLKLYDSKPNADSSLLVLDKLRYKLVKQK